MTEIEQESRMHVDWRVEEHCMGEFIGEVSYRIVEKTPLGFIAAIGYFFHVSTGEKGMGQRLSKG